MVEDGQAAKEQVSVADLEIQKGGFKEIVARKFLNLPRPLPRAYWESPVPIISAKRKILM